MPNRKESFAKRPRIVEQVKKLITAEHLRTVEYPRAVINYALILYANGICAEKALETAEQLLERKMNRKKMGAFVATTNQAFSALPIERNARRQPILPEKNITLLRRSPGSSSFIQALEWHNVISSLYKLAPAEVVYAALEKIPRPSNYEQSDWRHALRVFEKRPDLFGVFPFKPSGRTR